MRTRPAFLWPLLLTVCCQGTSVAVLTSPPGDDGMDDAACGPAGGPDAARDAGEGGADSGPGDAGDAGDAADASPKGPHGGTWPTYAHDFQRSSRGDGSGQLVSPEVAWTKPMGGLLSNGQAIVGDVNGDGRPDTVTVSGGRVTATGPDGTTLWQGGLAGVQTVLGIWNLDGVGSPEIVVDASTGVLVLDGATGMTLTTLPAPLSADANFAPLGATGGILVVGMTTSQLAGYDFRQGTSVTTPAWTTTNEDPASVVIGDVDGDGVVDIVHPLNAGFEVLDAVTGVVKYSADPIGPLAFFYVTQLANVDGNPGLEIIAVDTSYIYSPSAGIYVLGVRNGNLDVLWSSAVSSTVALSTDFETVIGAVQNLDGNGVDVVYSQWDGTSQSWTTQIADGPTGDALGSIPGQFLQAITDLDGDGKQEIVVRSNPGADQTPLRTTVSAYDFTRAAGPVARSWTVPNAHVMQLQNGSLMPVVGSFDPGAALEVLLGVDTAQSNSDSSLSVLQGDGSIAATYTVPAGVTPSVLWTGNALTSTTSVGDILTFGNDGNAHALSGALKQSATFTAGSYSNWLGVYGLDTSRTILTMATSNQDLLWLDGTHLHPDGTPYQPVHVPGVVDTSSFASAYFGMDPLTYIGGTAPTLVAFQQGPTNVTMVGLDTSGVELWTTPFAAGSILQPVGAYAQDMTGDGIPDPIVTLTNINSLESIAIFDGTTGVLVRSTPLESIIAGGQQTVVGALVDVNGDGVPDLVTPVFANGEAALNLAASPMTTLWSIAQSAVTPDTYSGTMAAQTVDSTGPTVLRFNGNTGVGAYFRASLTGTVLASADQGLGGASDRNGVAFVQRTPGATEMDLVAAGMQGVALGRVRRLAGDTLATVWQEYLVGGAVSTTAPTQGFALHDPIAFDVDGDGTDEVVLGSDDGYLYALHAADGSVLFTMNLGAPVAHVIAADVDLDPALELLASLADGRLVAIDGQGKYTAVRDPPSGDGGAPEAGEAGSTQPGDAAAPPPDAGMTCTMDGGDDYVPVHTGCSCRAAGRSGAEGGAGLTLLSLLVALVARKRGRVAS